MFRVKLNNILVSLSLHCNTSLPMRVSMPFDMAGIKRSIYAVFFSAKDLRSVVVRDSVLSDITGIGRRVLAANSLLHKEH